MAACFKIQRKQTNTLCGQKEENLMVKPGGTCSGHWAVYDKISVIKTSRFIMYMDTVPFCSQINTKQIKQLSG